MPPIDTNSGQYDYDSHSSIEDSNMTVSSAPTLRVPILDSLSTSVPLHSSHVVTYNQPLTEMGNNIIYNCLLFFIHRLIVYDHLLSSFTHHLLLLLYSLFNSYPVVFFYLIFLSIKEMFVVTGSYLYF